MPYAIKRFGDEAHRLYGVLNKRLAGRDYVAGDYSIADMALIGWIKAHERQGVDIAEFPNVKRWIDRMLARPAVAKAIEIRRDPPLDLSQGQGSAENPVRPARPLENSRRHAANVEAAFVRLFRHVVKQR